MNEENYGSLDACKRLVEARIVLRTDVWWYKTADGQGWWLNVFPTKMPIKPPKSAIPAPSMAEVWRELPEGDKDVAILLRDYLRKTNSWDHFNCLTVFIHFMRNIDSLIDLLIWQRKEKGND